MTDIQSILRETKAVITKDHFVYASKLHGEDYVNKDAIYPGVVQMEEVGRMLAAQCSTPEVILGPAVGGALLAQWVARALCFEDMMFYYRVLAVYADKDGDDFVIKRGYDKLIRGKKVLVVEDILNTGGSARKTVTAAKKCGADVIAVGAICNRGGVTAEDLGVPMLYSLVNISMATYPADECPFCREGRPINQELGHGKKFLAEQENQRAQRNAEHLIEGGMPSFRIPPSVGDDD